MLDEYIDNDEARGILTIWGVLKNAFKIFARKPLVFIAFAIALIVHPFFYDKVKRLLIYNILNILSAGLFAWRTIPLMCENLFYISSYLVVIVLLFRKLQVVCDNGLSGHRKSFTYYISVCLVILRRALYPMFIILIMSVISYYVSMSILMLEFQKDLPYMSWILKYSNYKNLYFFATLVAAIFDILKTVPILLTLACNDVLACEDELYVKPASLISFTGSVMRFYWADFFTLMVGWTFLDQFGLSLVLSALYSAGITGKIIYYPIYVTLSAYFLIAFSLVYLNAKKIYIDNKAQSAGDV
jgi:hypothetical protein